MHLTRDEVKRFYTIWFPLLHYVNQQRKLVPSFPDQWGDNSVDVQDAAKLRDALWADDTLLEGFIADNPAGLSAADLALVESWKHRVSGEFFIFRYLKKYTVFLSGQSPMRAYAVLGLVSPVEDIAGPYLPVYVKTVLLPFEGRIIYDSLMAPYPVYFGGGIRRNLNDDYRAIQEREGIITTLPPHTGDTDPESLRQNMQAKNKKILTAFQKALGQSGLSPKMIEEHTGTIARFAQEFLLSQVPPGLLLDITRPKVEAYLAAGPGTINLVSFKRFAQFLRDTGRMDYNEAEDLLGFLKRQRRG